MKLAINGKAVTISVDMQLTTRSGALLLGTVDGANVGS
jgi:hypothetical protein